MNELEKIKFMEWSTAEFLKRVHNFEEAKEFLKLCEMLEEQINILKGSCYAYLAGAALAEKEKELKK